MLAQHNFAKTPVDSGHQTKTKKYYIFIGIQLDLRMFPFTDSHNKIVA